MQAIRAPRRCARCLSLTNYPSMRTEEDEEEAEVPRGVFLTYPPAALAVAH